MGAEARAELDGDRLDVLPGCKRADLRPVRLRILDSRGRVALDHLPLDRLPEYLLQRAEHTVAGALRERRRHVAISGRDEPVERHVPERPDGLPQVGAELADRRRVRLVLRQVAVDELRETDFLPVEPAEPHSA